MVEDNEIKKRKSLFGARKNTRRAPVTAARATPAEVDGAPERAIDPTHDLAPERASEGNASTVSAPTDTPDTTSTSTSSDEQRVLVEEIMPYETDAPAPVRPVVRTSTSLLFQAPDISSLPPRAAPRRDGSELELDDDDDEEESTPTIRRRARRRSGDEGRAGQDDPANTVVKVRAPREPEVITEPQRIKGSTRLEAKKQRRRDGRDAGRRRPVITEAEFLARRESVDRVMVVRAAQNKIQIGVLEDGVLVEHYVAKNQDASLIGNVYLGRVQNVLPSMEAAFVDIGRGRNAVLYSGEVDWDAAAENSSNGNTARRIELALKPGDKVLVQVTKDPIGHKGARLTSQVSLPGRYLVYVPNGSMNGISRKLPDTERARLKKILKEVLPENVGVIVRTAAEGATDEQLTLDVNRLTAQWADIARQVETVTAPAQLHSEPDLLIKIVRDVFNEDFQKMVVSGDESRATIETYLGQIAPDLVERVQNHVSEQDAFDEYRVTEQIEKALDRKVWLPSGGSLVIDRTEAMTVVDVNTGKFVGSGGNLEETVTKNNLEAADEIVRQLRLRDIGGIIVVDFIDMVLETNRDLVLRRLIECLSRDRTKHQVAEVTSLGLVQMTRKKLGLGLLESFSENCEACAGRGIVIHHDPAVAHRQTAQPPMERRPRAQNGNKAQSGNNGSNGNSNNNGGGRNSGTEGAGNGSHPDTAKANGGTHGITEDAKNALALIAARTIVRPVTESIAVIEPVIELPIAAESTPTDAEANTDQNTNGNTNTSTDAPARAGRSRGDRGRGADRGRNRRGAADRNREDAASDSADAAASVDRAPEQAPAESPAQQAPAEQAPEPQTVPSENAEPVEQMAILDIPVTKSQRTRRPVSKQLTDQLLDSVLDALPEPKQPGQGRARSRRVTTAGGSTATAQPIVFPSRDPQN
ncbi:Rne/Rng family ribonuclease [Cryobacterium frigoriphilum]|uniref:Ribonuclease E n=1 Tax=Cryobacterium frigoriphilum TaxID=1259150 RepID=A0A4V3IS43_9MICO|nr:Rne/Rng family ribonuclease [Cryobacterium frigoriphilum]TFD55136.1 Rne/Rng family ribonuclease [Cryobacterium frigoriphilum]